MAIGRLVKKLMDKTGFETLGYLAEQSGISRRLIQEILYHDKTNLTVKTILKLAAVFEVKPERIFRELIKPHATGKSSVQTPLPRSNSL